MNFRYKFSVVLIILGLISAIMSLGGRGNASIPAEKILETLLKGDYKISADELANAIIEQEEGIQVVDVRNPKEYKLFSLPGSVNIPFPKLLNEEFLGIFGPETVKTVFYSENNELSTQALILSMQKGFRNVSVLDGGIIKWDSIIMQTTFSGDKISPLENALFEKRYKARRLIVQWNSMPDSLKTSFFAVKKIKDKELVGGCE